MSNFAFIYTPSNDWIGGKNYYLSLLSQLNNEINNDLDQVYIFTNFTTNLDEISKFDRLNFVKTKLLNKHGVYHFIFRLINKLFGSNVALILLLKKFNIDLLSHSYIPKFSGIKSLPWIPDFQHCFLPDLFTKKELNNRNKLFQCYLKNECFLLSSYSALKDANNFFDVKGKAHIYRFLPTTASDFDYHTFDLICKNKKIIKPYVFLPNQFWKHKNHLLCFQACLKAKVDGKEFLLVCSGARSDYRNPLYQEQIDYFISDNNLEEQIIMLGLIDRSVFNCFLEQSAIIVNPSKFEGWSTTVEEGKASGKPLALSDLSVHREQTEHMLNVEYFDVNDVSSCFNAINKLIYSPKVSNELVSSMKNSDSLYCILKSIV